MSDMNTDTIYRVASQYDLELPKEVTAAQALHDAAVEFRATVLDTPAPDLAGLTIKGIDKAHAALVDHANREARVTAADASSTPPCSSTPTASSPSSQP